MAYNCGCPIPRPQTPTNYIKIFRGDDTNFNNSQWLKILLITDIDLTGFQGFFSLLGYTYTGEINAEEKSLEIEIPGTSTASFPIGPADGVFRLEDTQNRFKTVSNTIPFFITNQVFNQQEQNIILDVPPDYPIGVTVQIPGSNNNGGGDKPAPGTNDYNELENLPTFNGEPWTGNQTYQSADIAPLSALNALENVVDEKPSAIDVQNALNGLSEQIATNKNDIGDLGDQVQNIEAKIPESASGTNMLVTKEQLDNSISSIESGDVDLTGYYNQYNLLGGNDIEIVEQVLPAEFDEHTLACWHLDNDLTNAVENVDWKNFKSVNGVANFNTDFYKFGTASFAAGAITGPGGACADSFTLDLWIQKFSSNGSGYANFGFLDSTYNNGIGFQLNYSINNNNIRLAGDKLLEEQELVNLSDFGINTGDKLFHHYALTYDKDNHKLSLFVDGKFITSATTQTTFTYTKFLYTAFRYNETHFRYDEVRLSDVVRYTKDFTPPTAPYPIVEKTGKYVVNYTGTAPEVDLIDYPTTEYVNDNFLSKTKKDIVSGDKIFTDGKLFSRLYNVYDNAQTDPTPAIDFTNAGRTIVGKGGGRELYLRCGKRIMVGKFYDNNTYSGYVLDTNNFEEDAQKADDTHYGLVKLGVANGAASLDANGQISANQIPVDDNTITVNEDGKLMAVGGGDVDLSGYLPTTGGKMTGTLVMDNGVGIEFKSGMYTGSISQRSVDHIMDINPHGGYLNVQGKIRNGVTGNFFLDEGQKGIANGLATLDSTGKVPASQLPDLTPAVATVTSEKYGIQADYALTHGIVDCPNGILDYSINNKEVSLLPGFQIMLGGAETLTQIGSTLKYTIEGTGKLVLFLTRTVSSGGTIQVGIIEVKKIFWQEAEPTYDGDGFAAWWSPAADKWYFLSSDTGNVWREAAAAGPFANVNAGNIGITSANYYGYSINDGKTCASLSDIDSILEQMSLIMNRLDALENK